MKGMVFTELLSMAESAIGEEAVDDILDTADLPSGGAYTSVGQYHCAELVTLVSEIGIRAKIPVDVLQRQFGQWMLGRFLELHPDFFASKPDALTMLEAIEGEVHVEVRKLYPDAELPKFETVRDAPGRLQMTYRSARPLEEFCHGLIEGCLTHFGTPGMITRQSIESGNSGVVEKFIIDLEEVA